MNHDSNELHDPCVRSLGLPSTSGSHRPVELRSSGIISPRDPADRLASHQIPSCSTNIIRSLRGTRLQRTRLTFARLPATAGRQYAARRRRSERPNSPAGARPLRGIEHVRDARSRIRVCYRAGDRCGARIRNARLQVSPSMATPLPSIEPRAKWLTNVSLSRLLGFLLHRVGCSAARRGFVLSTSMLAERYPAHTDLPIPNNAPGSRGPGQKPQTRRESFRLTRPEWYRRCADTANRESNW